jgi:hypothetical protein
MKYNIQNFIAGILLGFLIVTGVPAQENQKLAQSGFQFLSVVSDARAAAMAEAMTSLELKSSALFFNPAGMADMTDVFDVSASINQWIADIRHNSLSAAFKLFDGQYGVIGFSLQYVDYGDFYGTRVNLSSPQGYDDTGIFTLNALAIGAGYAKQLTDRFSIGGQVRWVHQDLGESMTATNMRSVTVSNGQSDTTITIADTSFVSNKLNPLVFDFGTQFRTGLKSLVFGMSVRNFSSQVKYAEEGFQAPLVFTLGVSMNVLDFAGEMPFDQSLYVSLDASHYRDHPEQVKVGIDYKILNALSLRGGYSSNNYEQSGFSFGVGLSQFGFSFDYSYTPFGIFDKVQRFTARFSLGDIFSK